MWCSNKTRFGLHDWLPDTLVNGRFYRRVGLILLVVSTIGLLAFAQHATPATSGQVDLPRFPSISPDGSEVVFSWGGDLWCVAAEGGQARRLTRHNLDDLRSSWSPDGEWIIFNSMRDGYLNLWRINRDGTRVSQVTHGDRFIRSPAYAVDETGQAMITFSGTLEADVYRDQRPYVVSPEGGEYARLHDAFGSEPQMSPDGRRIAFTRGGYYHNWSRRHYRGPEARNIWLYDRETGGFEAVTTRDGDDGSAQWLDSNTLIFMSDRELDTVNLYRVNLDDLPEGATSTDPEAGDVAFQHTFERITQFEGRDIQHFDVSRDGSTAVLHVWDTLYILDLEDPQAQPVPITVHANEDGRDNYALRRINRDVTEAALSPDGKVMAYIAYGRVYVRHMDEHSPTRAVTPGSHARHQHLAWSPDGVRLYFTSDEDGTDAIYEARVSLTREEISRTNNNGRPVVRRFLPKGETGGQDEPVVAQHREPPAPSGPDELEPSSPGQEPDDPFGPVDPAVPFDPSFQLEPHAPAEPDPIEEPVAEPETIPEEDLDPEPADAEQVTARLDPGRWHDAVQFAVRPLVQSEHNDRNVVPSPDGRFVAFRRNLGDLVIMDLRNKKERTLVKGWDTNIHWRWSPDSRYIAYSQNDMNYTANIFIVPVDGSQKPINITRHPRNNVNPRWSADSRILTFISNRSGGSYDLYRVYLDPAFENYTPRELSTYYRDARAAASKRQPLDVDQGRKSTQADTKVNLELKDAWRRVERVTASPTHQFANEMSPAGDRYVFNSSREGLMVMNWDGSGRQRLGPSADIQHLTLRGDRVVYIAKGRVGVVSLAGGTHQHPEISDSIRIDLRQQSLQKFREAARIIGESFYLEDMKGLDWEALTKDYEQLIVRARTASEFSDIANRMMGELAASHLGVSNPGPGSALRESTGRLGIESEHRVFDNDQAGYRITSIVPGGPAERGPIQLQPGDLITAIDLQPFSPGDTLLHRLRGQVDKEVVVTFERRVGNRQTEHRALLTPVSYAALAQLKYDAFRERSQKRVEELSQGRLGYIHIQAMNQASLNEFQGGLYAAAHDKEGLIIDVRNNGGGSTTDRILSSIIAPEHSYTIPARADPSQTGHYPQDRLDAPRYTMPINMLANEKSYSNAEILAHAFNTLERGTLVGQQTYGGVISTDRHTLIDGATVQRPFRGWYLPDGTDMEHNGAMPDLLVEQTPEDETADQDRQLEIAVKDLLERLDAEAS